MRRSKPDPILDRQFTALAECFTPEAARRLLAVKADAQTQSRIDKLAERHTAGTLTAAEEADYQTCVRFASFIAILKSKVRQLLTRRPVKRARNP